MAVMTTHAVSGDARVGARVIEVTQIQVAYKGGGRPFTVFNASLLIGQGDSYLGGLMATSHHVPAHLGGDFTIDHGRTGQGPVVVISQHPSCTLRLDCGEADFREISFIPTLLPDPNGSLFYHEGEREATYHEARAQ